MQITLESTIRRSPHFDERAWGGTADAKSASIEYELVNHVESIRAAYNDYLAKFSNMMSKVKIFL
jgi:hypothetical protein